MKGQQTEDTGSMTKGGFVANGRVCEDLVHKMKTGLMML